MKPQPFDIIVVGAGAAGVMAAGRAAELGASVLLLEKMEKPLRKLRISGKGRGNITNTKPIHEFLQKIYPDGSFLRPAFSLFFNTHLVQFLHKTGVRTVEERGGRVFPASQRAWDVAEALLQWARRMGVELLCHAPVTAVTHGSDGLFSVMFEHNTAKRVAHGKQLLLATGGLAYPATGSTGDGYGFAKKLGHSITPLRPSLTPIEVDGLAKFAFKDLPLRNVKLTATAAGKTIGEELGELTLTGFGISGPIALRMSRSIVDALQVQREVALQLDWKPALSKVQLQNRLERELLQSDIRHTGDLLRKLMPAPAIPFFAERAGLQVRAKVCENAKEKIVETLKCCTLRAFGYRPFSEAIITAGGVSVDEVDENTMQSKRVAGLYFAGELLDVDASTGGYNLQIAFSTGWLAGSKMAGGR
ncbi:MAG: aminoacetone oxidase family FAD-binding enzyme [Prevotellaceae bacterium]|nr:aminoacetone oxidase family FAD-binding enzyme [Prevotellaceae bacterium]